MPQTVSNLTGSPGQPGQRFDSNLSNADVVQLIAGAAIPAGVLVEALQVSGQWALFPLKDTSGALLAGTVSVTNASANITFSQNQTLAAGTRVQFASQAGVTYMLAEDVNAGTAGVLDVAYGGTTNAATTTTLQGQVYNPNLMGVSLIDIAGAEQSYVPYAVPNAGAGSSFVGWPMGKAVPIMRRGRIWTLWDGNTGNALPFPMGAMNVWHSSTGANPQGVVTTRAVASTAGGEIDLLPASCRFYDPRQVSGSYTDSFGNSNPIAVMSLNIT